MTLKLKKGLRDQLLSAMKNALRKGQIGKTGELHWRSFIKFEDELGSVLGAEPRIQRIFGEAGVWTFFYEQVVGRLNQNATDKDCLLTKVPQFSDVEIVAENLVEVFETLPWNYRITLTLPDVVSSTFAPHLQAETEISENWSLLVQEPRDESTQLPLSAGTQVFLGKGPQVLLRHGGLGYLDWISNRPLNWRFVEGVKTFFGCAEILHILMPSIFFGAGIRDFPSSPKIERENDNSWIDLPNYQFSLDIGESIEVLDTYRELEPKKIERYLEGMSKILSEGADVERLRQATSWHFDSFGRRNQLLSYIQASVAMEILLGEPEDSRRDQPNEVGLTRIIQERGAYLLGRTATERKIIAKELGQIYNTRSRIVHGHRSRLRKNELTHFNQLQEYVRRIIRKELDQMTLE